MTGMQGLTLTAPILSSCGGSNGAIETQRTVVAGRVSVIIPAYNCEETIAAAVDSCIAQAFGDMEVVVVDDGSTDGTLEVLHSFGARIAIVSQANGGLAAARNAGVRASSGEFVAWMDADDLAMPGRFRIQAAVLASRPMIKLVSSDFSAFLTGMPDFASSHLATYYQAVRRLGGVARIYPWSDPIESMENNRVDASLMRWGHAYELLLWGNFVHPPTVMVRRAALDKAGVFDENLRYNSDYDLIVRIARTGPIAFIDTPLLRYRVSGTQMSHAAAFGRIPLETVDILEKVRREDPDTYTRHRSLFQLRVAESLIAAAEGIAASDRSRALQLLLRGVRLRLLLHKAMRAFALIVAPDFAMTAVRRVRRFIVSTFA